jgi:hypothetical protein
MLVYQRVDLNYNPMVNEIYWDLIGNFMGFINTCWDFMGLFVRFNGTVTKIIP